MGGVDDGNEDSLERTRPTWLTCLAQSWGFKTPWADAATRRWEERNGHLAALRKWALGRRQLCCLFVSVVRDVDPIPYTHVLSHPGMYSGILVGLLQAPVRPECDLGIILLVQTDETTWPLLKNSAGMDFYQKQLITQLKILVKMHFVNVTYYPPENHKWAATTEQYQLTQPGRLDFLIWRNFQIFRNVRTKYVQYIEIIDFFHNIKARV